MSWFSRLFQARPAPVRRRVVAAGTLHNLLRAATSGIRSGTHALRLGDRDYASVTRAEVEAIARRVWRPWVRDIADCDDQALVLMVACREAAFAEGGHIPWGVGLIFTAGPSAHAYTWALTVREPGLMAVEFYDQTAGRWVAREEMDQPVTLTLG